MSLNLPNSDEPIMQTSKLILEEEDKKNQKIDKNYLIVGGVNIILQSPNGTYYKIEVDNSGNLSTSSTTQL